MILLEDPHRFKVLVWHRRARKTVTAINELTRNALTVQGVYWHVFPTFTEAKDVVWRQPDMLFNIIPKQAILKINETDLTVFLINGSLIQLKGADKPERLLGAGIKGAILDEYAEMKPETWERIIQPMLRANGGFAWFIGTPRGRNHFYDLYNYGKSGNSEWMSQKLDAISSGVIPRSELEEARKTMRESLFNQEFMCEFLEGEGVVFRNVKAVCTSVPEKPKLFHYYVIGVDLAKVRDYTVISVFDRANNNEVYSDRFNTIEWPFIKMKIIEIAKHYNDGVVVIDATGLGDPIVDDLQRAGVSVLPFKITNESKKNLIEKLAIWIEQQKLRLIPTNDKIFELENFSYEILPSGRIRYEARPGLHDDCVIAIALAVSELQPILIEEVPKRELSLIRSHLLSKIQPKDEQNEYIEAD